MSNKLMAIVDNHTATHSPLFGETFFEKVSMIHTKDSQQTVKTLNRFQGDYNNVAGYSTANVAYMLKFFSSTLKASLPCLCHILNFVTKALLQEFDLATTWAMKISSWLRVPPSILLKSPSYYPN